MVPTFQKLIECTTLFASYVQQIQIAMPKHTKGLTKLSRQYRDLFGIKVSQCIPPSATQWRVGVDNELWPMCKPPIPTALAYKYV